MKTRRTSQTPPTEIATPPQHAKGGFSIVLTLLVIVMMTVLVIGFNAATRTEQMAARNFSFQEQANQMAMLAINRGMELLDNSFSDGITATRPGGFFKVGKATGQVLTSEAYAKAASRRTNLNTWTDKRYSTVTTINTNFFIGASTDANAFTVPLVDVKPGTNTNVVGRYGFWIDDDGSRLNLNAAWTNARTTFFPTNARPLGLFYNSVANGKSSNTFVFLAVSNTTNALNFARNFAACVTSMTNTNGYGWFFTPRQAQVMFWPNRDTVRPNQAVEYNKVMFSIGAGPLNRPSNSYALVDAGVTNTSSLDALTTANPFLAAYGAAPNYALSMSALTNALDVVAGKYFRGSRYGTYFNQSGGFVAKYGSGVVRQIIANINDAVLSGDSGPFTGANTTDMLLGPNTTGTNLSAPSTVLGLRPSLFLNEVAVGAAYSTNSPASQAEVQVWMTSELVDPYATGQGATYEIRYKIASLQFNGTFTTNGKTVNFSNTTFSANWNYDGSTPTGAPQGVTSIGALTNREFKIPANAFAFEWQLGGSGGAVPSLPANASNVTVTRVTVKPAAVLLRQRFNVAGTVRDWAVLGDFPTNGFTFTNPPSVAIAFGYGGSKPSSAPNSRFTQSIEKNDPRVRRLGTNAMPTNFPAWTFVSTPTLGANNSSVNFSGGTGIPGVGNDRIGTVTTIYDHPSFPTSASPTNALNIILGRGNWISAFDLSRIHTGLQWRTLQFRAQDDAESAAGHVPDWALLEAFGVGDAGAAVTCKLNVNSLVYPLASNTPAKTLIDDGLARPAAIASLLSGLTATNAAKATIGTNNLGLPSSTGFANETECFRAATNISSLAFTNSWATRRATNNAYLTNLYTLSAEVLEVNNVSNFSPTNEAANEARAQGVYDGITVSSEVFTIYAAGFATDKQGNEVAETRLRAQVVRDTNTKKFKIVFLEPLIWP